MLSRRQALGAALAGAVALVLPWTKKRTKAGTGLGQRYDRIVIEDSPPTVPAALWGTACVVGDRIYIIDGQNAWVSERGVSKGAVTLGPWRVSDIT